MSDDTANAKQVNPKVLVALVKRRAEIKTEVADLNLEVSERLKHAVENGLHRKAFTIIAAMDNMDELKRNAFWTALQLYVDILTEERWNKDAHTGDLLDSKPAVDPDAEAAASNVTALRKGIKALAEDTPPSPPDALEEAFGLPPLGDKAGTYSVA